MTLVLLMAQLGLVLIFAMVLGRVAERLRLPAIAGQLLAGVVLGPTLFGALFPGLFAILFPAHNTALKAERTDFLQVGLLLFIFVVGLEIDVGTLRERLRVIAPTSILSIIIPFAAGFAVILWVSRKLGSRVSKWVESHARRAVLALGLILAIMLLAAAAMEGIGAHSFFGALLVGLALSSTNREFLEPVERVVRSFFA